MCKQGIEATLVKLQKPRKLDGKPFVSVDPCIAPLVQALNDAGFKTLASCCGHGKMPGNIILDDERELFIVSDYEEGRRMEKIFIKFGGYRSLN